MDFAVGFLIFAWAFVLIWVPIVIVTQKKVHPKALFTLFFAELWERFSFYGMRALLILYMTKYLFDAMSRGEADIKALGIYGAYGALVYAAPVIGGLIADRILGFRKAIILGGIMMALGHFTLGLEGPQTSFFIALAFIVVGNGFFKPNISSFLGTFYEKNDPRKDGAFTIFYMGVNIGAFVAPLTCGYLFEKVDFFLGQTGVFWGFTLAGIGMLIGLIVFWKNMSHFSDKGLPPKPEWLKKPMFLGMSPQILVYAGSALVVPLFAALFNVDRVTKIGLVSLSAIILGYMVYHAFQLIGKGEQILEVEDQQSDENINQEAEVLTQSGKAQGQRLLVVVVLFFFHMLFWALFEQAGGSLTLFADRVVDRNFFGTEIPTTFFQSLNPLFIMLLAPVFSWIWLTLRKKKKEPRTPVKFVAGLGQLAIGFGIIVIGANFVGLDGKVPMIFLVLMYLFHTTGELSISPVGLSLVTKLSPKLIVGFVMGAWFLSISLAHELAGTLGKLTAVPDENADVSVLLAGFTDVYLVWGVGVIAAAAIVLYALSFILKKWMHGIH